MGRPLFDCSWAASSWITSQCSIRLPSLIRRMSAAIQFTGWPTPENRPCTITKSFRPQSFRVLFQPTGALSGGSLAYKARREARYRQADVRLRQASAFAARWRQKCDADIFRNQLKSFLGRQHILIVLMRDTFLFRAPQNHVVQYGGFKECLHGWAHSANGSPSLKTIGRSAESPLMVPSLPIFPKKAVAAQTIAGFDSRNGLARKLDGRSVMRGAHNALPDSHWTNLPNGNLLT
jgi:hypothetical protein